MALVPHVPVTIGDKGISTGVSNTQIGKSIVPITTGINNTLIGSKAGTRVTSGNYNVAIGESASINPTGTGNTVLGNDTANTAMGNYNTIMGYGSGTGLTSDGASNTFVGYSSGLRTNSGIQNTSIGEKAGFNVNSGSQNTNIGSHAGYNSTSGYNNVNVGYQAGYNSTSAFNNTLLGHYSGYGLTYGAGNICIGYYAGTPSSGTQNSVTLGNTSITNLRCQDTSISSVSDARDKTDIVNCPMGLDYINSLRPVKFKWDYRKEHYIDGEAPSKDGTQEVGFIAQELKTAQDAHKDGAALKSYQHYPAEIAEEGQELASTHGIDLLEADYGKLLPVAIQAIKELSDKVDKLEAQLNYEKLPTYKKLVTKKPV